MDNGLRDNKTAPFSGHKPYAIDSIVIAGDGLSKRLTVEWWEPTTTAI